MFLRICVRDNCTCLFTLVCRNHEAFHAILKVTKFLGILGCLECIATPPPWLKHVNPATLLNCFVFFCFFLWTQEYQKVVDAEWTILYNKLEKIVSSGAKVVLSKLPIGDVATQYFADR